MYSFTWQNLNMHKHTVQTLSMTLGIVEQSTSWIISQVGTLCITVMLLKVFVLKRGGIQAEEVLDR